MDRNDQILMKENDLIHKTFFPIAVNVKKKKKLNCLISPYSIFFIFISIYFSPDIPPFFQDQFLTERLKLNEKQVEEGDEDEGFRTADVQLSLKKLSIMV